MTNWWDSAPLAQTKPAATQGNWWDAAPLATAPKAETKPQGQPEANSMADYAMAVPEGITKGLMGVVALPRTLNDLAAKGVDWATGEAGHRSLAKDIGLPTYQDVKGGFEKGVSKIGQNVFNKQGEAVMPEAQGFVPKLIESGAAMAAPIPGAGVEKAINYGSRFAGGVTSELAGQMPGIKGTSWEAPVRIAASFVGPAGVQGVKSAVFPEAAADTAEVAARAKELGVPLSLDQVAPSKVRNTVQKISQELPFSGVDDFTTNQRAAWNKALVKTLGEDADSLHPEVIQGFLERTGKEFDNILSGKSVTADKAALQGVNDLLKSSKNTYGPETLGVLENNISDLKSMVKKSQIPGEALSSFRSQLVRSMARASGDAKSALGDLLEHVDDLASSALSGDEQAALGTVRRQYRNFKTVEPLLEKAQNGVVNPTDLMSRVAASKYIKASRTPVGQDDLVDLARIGKMMPIKGGSDTFQKVAGGGAVGGALMNPSAAVVAAPKVAAGLGANRLFQSYVNQNPYFVNAAVEKALAGNPKALQVVQALSSGGGAAGGGGVSGPTSQVLNALSGAASIPNNPSVLQRAGKAVKDGLSKVDPAKNRLASRPEAAIIAASLAGGGALGNYLGAQDYYAAHPATNTPTLNREDAPVIPNSAADQKPMPTASDRTNFIQKLFHVESGNNPNAAAKTSNAVGLGQFVPATWLPVFDKLWPEHKGWTPEQKLEKRRDPAFMEKATHFLLDENDHMLQKSDLPLTDGTRYLMWFLGPSARNVLNAPANHPVTPDMVGAGAIKANPTILRGKTAAQVVQWAEAKMAGALPNVQLASNI